MIHAIFKYYYFFTRTLVIKSIDKSQFFLLKQAENEIIFRTLNNKYLQNIDEKTEEVIKNDLKHLFILSAEYNCIAIEWFYNLSNQIIGKESEFKETFKGLSKISPENYKIDRPEVRSALKKAAENGNLEVIKWLKDTFNLTPEDAKADGNYALRKAAQNRHLEVEEWLAEEID